MNFSRFSRRVRQRSITLDPGFRKVWWSACFGANSGVRPRAAEREGGLSCALLTLSNMSMAGQQPGMIFDEYGRPFIILKEQQEQARVKGLAAQKVRYSFHGSRCLAVKSGGTAAPISAHPVWRLSPRGGSLSDRAMRPFRVISSNDSAGQFSITFSNSCPFTHLSL